MLRAFRWLVATLIGLTVLFGGWWLGRLLGLADEAAIPLAAGASAIAAGPCAWWATRPLPDEEDQPTRGPRGRLVTRASAFVGALLTAVLGLLAGLVLTLFVGSITNLLVWVGPGGPYPSAALPERQAATGEQATYLVDLEALPESDSVLDGPQRIGTDSYPRSLYGSTGCSDTTSVTYRLDGRYASFEATAGPSADSRSGNAAVYTIYVDENSVESFSVGTDEARPVLVDVRDAMRLRISWEDGGAGRCFTGNETVAVLGDPRLLVR